jgi:Ca2+-binding RTX toxin-like protein
VVDIRLADTSGSDDSISLQAKALGANDNLKFIVADVETVSIKADSATITDLDLSGISMTAAGATTTVAITGTNDIRIVAGNADIATIDASGNTGGVDQSARANTSAVTYTGGAGNDTFIMQNAGDVIAAGVGTADTLTVSKAAILGGISVDLNAANQIVSFNGAAISGTITGFEDVDLSGYTGSFGAQVSALNTVGSTITGTGNADVILGGTGGDTITGGAGADTLTGGASADTFVLTDRTAIDTITDFAQGSDKVSLAGGAVAVTALAVAGIDGSETLVFDTAANLGALGVSIGDQSGGSAVSYAVASDTGAIFFDADGDWSAGSVQIGTVGVVAGLAATDFVI